MRTIRRAARLVPAGVGRASRLRIVPALAGVLAIAACSSSSGGPAGDRPPQPPPPQQQPGGADDAPIGRTPTGERVRVELAGERIAKLTPEAAATTAASGGWLWPAIVDSHVHLTYWQVADRVAASGIAAAVDLAAPTTRGWPPLHILAAGPMLTRPGGYPLESWGKDGYGLPCADAAGVTAAVNRLADQGAGVIKLALEDNGLDFALVPAAVTAAHARELKVAVHAMTDRAARIAADAGVDLLAHTPVEPLAPATIAAWRGRAVISTLAAFGGSPAAVANLRALRAAGATVLYGTDLGYLRDAGPSADEVDLLRAAGLDDGAITDAMTTAPARFWGFPFGAIAPGAEASLLVLDRDPRTDARALLAPRAVWLRGRRVR